jgi:hypothetical protein
MTSRQFHAWNAYFELELEHPSRADFYAMRIAAEVAMSRGVPEVELRDFALSFNANATDAVEDSKSAWGQLVGINAKRS